MSEIWVAFSYISDEAPKCWVSEGTRIDLPDGRRAEWVLGVAREIGNEALVVTASPG